MAVFPKARARLACPGIDGYEAEVHGAEQDARTADLSLRRRPVGPGDNAPALEPGGDCFGIDLGLERPPFYTARRVESDNPLKLSADDQRALDKGRRVLEAAP